MKTTFVKAKIVLSANSRQRREIWHENLFAFCLPITRSNVFRFKGLGQSLKKKKERERENEMRGMELNQTGWNTRIIKYKNIYWNLGFLYTTAIAGYRRDLAHTWFAYRFNKQFCFLYTKQRPNPKRKEAEKERKNFPISRNLAKPNNLTKWRWLP